MVVDQPLRKGEGELREDRKREKGERGSVELELFSSVRQGEHVNQSVAGVSHHEGICWGSSIEENQPSPSAKSSLFFLFTTLEISSGQVKR